MISRLFTKSKFHKREIAELNLEKSVGEPPNQLVRPPPTPPTKGSVSEMVHEILRVSKNGIKGFRSGTRANWLKKIREKILFPFQKTYIALSNEKNKKIYPPKVRRPFCFQ